MNKSEEILEKLEESLSDYIKSIGNFQHENEPYASVGRYRSDEYSTCEIYGHERMIDIYVIQDSKGDKLRIGNVCIERINQKIKKWYANYEEKKNNIKQNSQLIDEVDEILTGHELRQLPIYISQKGITRLQNMLERMCKGKNPTDTQVKLAQYYITKRRRQQE